VRVQVRVSLVALIVSALVAVMAPAGAQAFGIEKFFAGNCSVETCGEGAKEAKEAKEEEVEGFREAGGDVPFGVTDFKIKSEEIEPGVKVPEGLATGASISHVRVDVAPGVVTNPEAVTRCSISDFTQAEFEPKNFPGVFTEPKCPESSLIGENIVHTIKETAPGSHKFEDVEFSGPVYNLEQGPGLGSEFGVALEVVPLGGGKFLAAHTIIEGSVEWGSNYHDLFEIKNIPPGLLESRLVFKGARENTFGFLRNPSACTVPGPETTTTLTVENILGQKQGRPYENKVGSTACSLGFEPEFALTPATTLSDQPDGIATTVTAKHPEKESERDTADLKTAKVVLPEGMTLNPSAAAGLEGCTRAQFGIETRRSVECPSGSKIGTVELELPTLPAHSLSGPIFLGQPEESGVAKPIEKAPYKVYVDAESARYGQIVRLVGSVQPNATTGRLETTFEDTTEGPEPTPNNIPQGPFNSITMHFKGGNFAAIANPLCGSSTATSSFQPFSGSTISPVTGELPFAVSNCASSAPFAPTQTTTVLPNTGGAESNFTFKLERPEGQQYLEKISTVLPEGLVGKIPSVPQCTEAQAVADSCPATSKIGTVTAAAGSGTPFSFNGTVYLVGPFQGAPYGLLFAVPVVAGPFNLGTEYVHAKITVNPTTAQISVSTTELPKIRAGIPTRLRSMTVDIDRPNYILNPTSCATSLKAVSTVVSTQGTTALTESPFQEEGCGGLTFTPKFTASTTGAFAGNQIKAKQDGAGLVTTITQAPGQSNIKSVLVQLPKLLPSRLTTLQKACVAKTFEANPLSCGKESMVGTAEAVTPVLPNVMKGPAILVSHAGEEFPSLELVLEADNIRVIVEGKTHIKNKITTTDFETSPDVPISSVTVSLPTGAFSALALERLTTNVCTQKLVMPTTITGQNGKVVKQNTVIAPSGCGVQIVGHKVVGNTAYLTVETYSAGRITGSGSGLSTSRRSLGSAAKATTLKVPLSRGGRGRRRPFSAKIRVGFTPKQKGGKSSSATVTVRFR
jgi:hypothetical protein